MACLVTKECDQLVGSKSNEMTLCMLRVAQVPFRARLVDHGIKILDVHMVADASCADRTTPLFHFSERSVGHCAVSAMRATYCIIILVRGCPFEFLLHCVRLGKSR